MAQVGTTATNLSAATGAVVDELGNQLVGTDTTGGEAQTLGPQLQREIQAYIPNGDFSLVPDKPLDPITSENPLPFWTFVNPDPDHVELRLVEASGSASGYELRFRVLSGAPTGTAGAAGNTWYLSRYIPAAASRARSFIYQPRTTWSCSAGSSSANISVWAEAQFYTRDQVAIGSAATGSAVSTGLSQEVGIQPGSGYAVESNAGYILYKTGITVTGAITNTEECVIREIRMDQGTVQNILADQSSPGSYRGTLLLNNGRLTTSVTGGAGAAAYIDAVATSTPNSRGTWSFDTVAPIGATFSNGTVSVPQTTVTKLALGASPDTGAGIANPASDEITPPAGLYLVTVNAVFAAESGGKYRRVRIFKNSAAVAGVNQGNMAASVPDDELNVSAIVPMNGTDTLSARADHDHNGNIDVTCTEFSLIRLGAAW